MLSLKALVLSTGILAISCSPAKILVPQGPYTEIPLSHALKSQYVQVDIQPTNPETRTFYAKTSFKEGSEFTKEYNHQLELIAEISDSIKNNYKETDTAIINERYKGRWTLGVLAKKLGINRVAFKG